MPDDVIVQPSIRRRSLKIIIVLFLLVAAATTVYFATRPNVSLLKSQAKIALVSQEHQRALELSEQVLERSPNDLEAAQIAGDASVGLKQFERAFEFFERVPVSPTDESMMVRVKAGQILMTHLGRPDDAEKRFRSVLKHNPEQTDALLALSTLLGILARQREAIPFILRLLRQKKVNLDLLSLIADDNRVIARADLLKMYKQRTPNSPSVLVAEAWRVWNSPTNPNPRQAMLILKDTHRKHPEFHLAHDMLIQLLWQQQRIAESAVLLQSRFDSGEVPSKCWIIRGKLAEDEDNFQGAARCYWEAFRRTPTSTEAVYNLSRMASKLGLNKAASRLRKRLVAIRHWKQVYDVALSSQHESLEPLKRLSIALEQIGRLWEAEAWCQIAANINPQEIWPRTRSAELIARLKKCTLTQVCGISTDIGADFSKIRLPRWRTIPSTKNGSITSTSRITFRDDTVKSGITFQYFNSPNPSARGQRMFEFPGGGCAVLDFDGDGWPDLHFTQGCRWPVQPYNKAYLDRLYRNLGNGRFEDVTVNARLVENHFTAGVAVGDFNNDGFPDLYVSNSGKNCLFQNNGDGTFQNVTEMAGVGDPRWSTSCLIADLNGDSLPDIYSTNYLTGQDVFSRICAHNDGKPRMCMPFHFSAAQDQLYLNLGNGRFQNATKSSGVVVKDGKGLGVIAADLSGNRQLDLIVANDTVMNSLFVNQSRENKGTPTFTEQGLIRGVAMNRSGKTEGCMGLAVGDVDEDGRLDLFVTNFHRETNTLYLQHENHSFSDRTRESGLALGSREMLGFGAQFLDADLNGTLDLVLTNGHIDNLSSYGRPYKMRSQFFLNKGKAQFVELPADVLGQFFRTKALGRGLATLDWNRDFKEDFVVSYLDRHAAIVTNTTNQVGHALKLRFRGVTSARDACGVTIRATIGTRVLTRQLTAGGGYQASNQQHLLLGLEKQKQVDRLDVFWPSGTRQTFHNIASGQELIVVESNPLLLRLPR